MRALQGCCCPGPLPARARLAPHLVRDRAEELGPVGACGLGPLLAVHAIDGCSYGELDIAWRGSGNASHLLLRDRGHHREPSAFHGRNPLPVDKELASWDAVHAPELLPSTKVVCLE